MVKGELSSVRARVYWGEELEIGVRILLYVFEMLDLATV